MKIKDDVSLRKIVSFEKLLIIERTVMSAKDKIKEWNPVQKSTMDSFWKSMNYNRFKSNVSKQSESIGKQAKENFQNLKGKSENPQTKKWPFNFKFRNWFRFRWFSIINVIKSITLSFANIEINYFCLY